MELGILGPVEVRTHDRQHLLDGSKQRTVLAALLLARQRMVSDNQLSALLWGTEPPATMNAQIYTYVSRLRKLLGDEATILRQRPGYTLRLGSATFDLAEFENASRLGQTARAEKRYEQAAEYYRVALALWRGPALTDVTEHLADRWVPRLEEARMAALANRIDVELALGRHTQLVPELTGLVSAYPLTEPLRAQLMTALLRSGRQADALAVYQTGREVLADELGVDPGPALTAALLEVLTGDTSPPVRPPGSTTAGGWVRPRPAMLPADIGDFIGREKETEQLRGLLGRQETSYVRVVTLHGMPGVGKTALAVHALHGLTDEFPDGQLYASFGAGPGRRVSAFDVLGGFLTAVGVDPGSIPADEAGRVQLYRSQLADRRMLVLLDDATDAGQVRPLLPGGPGCAVVVTGRSHLAALSGSRPVRVEPLGAAASERLLLQAAPPGRLHGRPRTVARVVAHCGGLPLALRAAAARLTTRPARSLRRITDQLDQGWGLDDLVAGDIDVRAAFAASYQRLDIPTRTTLRRLALLDAEVLPGWAAAAVMGVSAELGEDLAEALAEASLLEATGAARHDGPRYRLHPLVRRFARERAAHEDTPRERAAALDRALGAWLALADEAARHLPGQDRHADRSLGGTALRWRLGARLSHAVRVHPIEWFIAESVSLQQLARQAERHQRPAAAWEIAHVTAAYFQLRGDFRTWHTTHRRALTAAQSGGEKLGEAVLQLDLARLADATDNVVARLSHAGRAAGLFATLGSEAHESRARTHLGAAYRQSGHLGPARFHLSRALDLAQKSGDRSAAAAAHQALGDLLHDNGEREAAGEQHTLALHTWWHLDDRQSMAGVRCRLAALALESDRPDEAAAHLAVARELATDRLAKGVLLIRRGQLEQHLGRLDQARRCYRRAVRVFGALGLRRRSGHAAALQGIGELTLAEGQPIGALHLLGEATTMWRDLTMPLRAARSLDLTGDAQVACGRFEDALETWQAVTALRTRDAHSAPGSGATAAAASTVQPMP